MNKRGSHLTLSLAILCLGDLSILQGKVFDSHHFKSESGFHINLIIISSDLMIHPKEFQRF